MGRPAAAAAVLSSDLLLSLQAQSREPGSLCTTFLLVLFICGQEAGPCCVPTLCACRAQLSPWSTTAALCAALERVGMGQRQRWDGDGIGVRIRWDGDETGWDGDAPARCIPAIAWPSPPIPAAAPLAVLPVLPVPAEQRQPRSPCTQPRALNHCLGVMEIRAAPVPVRTRSSCTAKDEQGAIRA